MINHISLFMSSEDMSAVTAASKRPESDSNKWARRDLGKEDKHVALLVILGRTACSACALLNQSWAPRSLCSNYPQRAVLLQAGLKAEAEAVVMVRGAVETSLDLA